VFYRVGSVQDHVYGPVRQVCSSCCALVHSLSDSLRSSFFFVCHVSFILGEAYIADGGAFHCSESVERSEYSWSNDAVEVAEAYVFFF